MNENLVRRLRRLEAEHKKEWGGATEESCLIAEAADAIEKLSMPIAVICKDGCTFCHEDFGDEYTPPSFECVKMEELEKLNIEASWYEHDLSIPEGAPVCPFFLDADMISNLFWQYHYGEKLVRDEAFFEMEARTHALEV